MIDWKTIFSEPYNPKSTETRIYENWENTGYFSPKIDKSKDPFDSIEWRKEATGSPVIKDCVAWVDCSIGDIHDAGDHYIVIGEVQRIGSENQKDGPLLFLGGSYGSFTELTGS